MVTYPRDGQTVPVHLIQHGAVTAIKELLPAACNAVITTSDIISHRQSHLSLVCDDTSKHKPLKPQISHSSSRRRVINDFTICEQLPEFHL